MSSLQRCLRLRPELPRRQWPLRVRRLWPQQPWQLHCRLHCRPRYLRGLPRAHRQCCWAAGRWKPEGQLIPHSCPPTPQGQHLLRTAAPEAAVPGQREGRVHPAREQGLEEQLRQRSQRLLRRSRHLKLNPSRSQLLRRTGPGFRAVLRRRLRVPSQSRLLRPSWKRTRLTRMLLRAVPSGKRRVRSCAGPHQGSLHGTCRGNHVRDRRGGSR